MIMPIWKDPNLIPIEKYNVIIQKGYIKIQRSHIYNQKSVFMNIKILKG